MTGYVSVMGGCIRCHRVFLFSPTKVPSVVVDGRREPLCQDCVLVLNQMRVERGMDPLRVLPGAYEGDPEDEVPWDE